MPRLQNKVQQCIPIKTTEMVDDGNTRKAKTTRVCERMWRKRTVVKKITGLMKKVKVRWRYYVRYTDKTNDKSTRRRIVVRQRT